MKKKLIILCLFLLMLFFCSNTTVYSYSVNDSNNPGVGTVDRESGGAGKGTSWSGNPLKAIRIRIFRGSTSILSNDGYYFITDKVDNCKNKVDAQICETDSYDYTDVTNSAEASCKKKTVTLGCVVSPNLPSSWGLDFYNGTYLDTYLKNGGTYNNLKKILEGMGYNNSNFKNTDVVVVEPVTFVTCAGDLYFGTSTALMKNNVSYSGEKNNKCAADDNIYDGKWIGYTFKNVFRNMSTAFKTDWAVSYATTAEKNQNILFGNDNNKKANGFGFFLYDVSGMGYSDTDGDLKIRIIDQNGKEISSANATFKVYSGSNCNGTEIDTVTTSVGWAPLDDLELGQYTVCQDSHPNGYNQIPISAGGTEQTGQLTESGIIFTFQYSQNSSCQGDLAALGANPTPSQLFALYKTYKKNGLLNLSNPSCQQVECSKNKINLTGCLAATSNTSYTENSNFNAAKPNLSCFDVVEAEDNYIFCNSTAYTLTNNFPVSKFYGKNGGLLIKKTPSNSYIYYNSNLEEQSISSAKGIATAKRVNVCYSIDQLTPEEIDNYVKLDATDFEKLYFGMNDYTGRTDNLNTNGYDSHLYNLTGTLKRYKYTYYVDYDFLPFYLKKITGEYRNIRTQWTTSEKIYGLLSKFNDEKEGEIPFQLGNLKPTKDELKCWYELKPEIIIENKLQLEFRTIDTIKPFNRNTKSNWCDGTDCVENNNTVQTYITNRTNSYGFKTGSTERQQPIYKITLTPNDIKLIRKYNKDHPYDDYNIYCNNKAWCESAFLGNLKQGFLRKYAAGEESVVAEIKISKYTEQYGNLSNKLKGNIKVYDHATGRIGYHNDSNEVIFPD